MAAAWFRPDLFRRVLTYSGTYVNQQYPFNPATPKGCWEFHGGQELIANSPQKPIRVCLFNTERDIGWDLPERTWHNWTLANTRMATVLKQKGYACRHIFCREAGHVDGRAIAQTVAGGLEWLFAGFVSN
jgi:enterochelin esterase family protein